MDIKNIAEWLLIVGGIVHLLLGVGQTTLVASIPFVGIVELAVGVSALFILAKKIRLI